MLRDPIIEELHRFREQMWEECHGSIGEMAERQRVVQEQLKDRLVDPEEWKRHRGTDWRSPE